MKVETKAFRRIEKYYKTRTGKSLFFYPIALYHYNNKHYDDAYQILVDGLQHFPRYTLALTLIGKILMDEGNYESAIAYLETAASIQKTNVNCLKLLALCYEQLESFDKLQEVYEKIIKLTDDEETKEKLIKLAGKVKPKEDISKFVEELGGEEDKNIPKIELEDETEENEEEATITLARLYEKQGYINDAIETYKKVLKKEPDNLEAKEALGRLLNDVGLTEGENNGDA